MIRPLLSRMWRNRCHWGLAVLVLPATLLPEAIKPVPAFPQPEGLPVQAGPWTARLWPLDDTPPHPAEGLFPEKEFVIKWCDSCTGAIRQARLLVARSAPAESAIREHGTLLRGPEPQPSAPVPVPPETGARLWLWAEGWDGQSHLTSLPLPPSGPSPSVPGPSITGAP